MHGKCPPRRMLVAWKFPKSEAAPVRGGVQTATFGGSGHSGLAYATIGYSVRLVQVNESRRNSSRSFTILVARLFAPYARALVND